MSPREFNGHTFTSTQRGYDEAGNPVPIGQAFTIVTEHEPRWDDSDRAQMLGLGLHEAGICRECGYHDDLKDPAKYQYQIEVDQCAVCASTDAWRRKLAKDDKAEADYREANPEDNPLLPYASEGRRIAVRPRDQR